MNHYLIVFDRLNGQVVHDATYADRHEALRARFEAEREHRGDLSIEVVVLAADSRDALRRTHARYFKPVRGLLQSALKKASVPPGLTAADRA